MIDHLSYSSISSYLLCAANWKMHYVEKIPTKASSALVFGSAFHNTVEAFIAGGHQGDLLALWREKWTTQLEADQVTDFAGASPEVEYNLGVRMLDNPEIRAGILSINAAKREDGAPAIETRVELRVPGVPVPIIGYIDVMTPDGPGDFKTSARAWTQDKADDELQTLFYLAALNQAGKPVAGGNFTHYIFVKTKTPQFQTIRHQHNPREIFWLFQLIQSVWVGIEREVYPINPTGWKCSPNYCDYYHLCRGRWK